MRACSKFNFYIFLIGIQNYITFTIKYKLSYHNNLNLRYLPKRNKNICLHKDSYVKVYIITIKYRIQANVHQLVNEQTVIHQYNRIRKK